MDATHSRAVATAIGDSIMRAGSQRKAASSEAWNANGQSGVGGAQCSGLSAHLDDFTTWSKLPDAMCERPRPVPMSASVKAFA